MSVLTTNLVAPKEVGFSAERLQRINAKMQIYVEQDKLGGTVTLIARRGQVCHFECIGQRDREAGKPMTCDTIFRIYSMTKPITSVAALMLYEEGHFQLDDPLSNFLPAFAHTKVYAGQTMTGMRLVEQEQPMTIRHLLTHTGGLSYGWFEDSPVEALYRQEKMMERNVSLAEFTDKLAHLPLLTQPGTAWRYSLSTDVLGHLVEVISGMTLDRFFAERIFRPLGMKETAFTVPHAARERFAAVYGPDTESGNGGIKVLDAPADSSFTRQRRFLSGGGGLVSTAADYVRFAQMLLNGGELNGTRLLSRKTVDLMALNHLPATLLPLRIGDSVIGGYGFGLGVSVLMDVAGSGVLGSVGEYGWSGAATTRCWIDPQEELVGLFLTQFMPSGHYPITREFKTLMYQALVD